MTILLAAALLLDTSGAVQAATEEVMVIEAEREEPGETRREVPPEVALTIPGTQGDALKAIQNLPGLARVPYGAGALLVRGAGPATPSSSSTDRRFRSSTISPE